ncbi:multiple epidermal growth factor-like domains protein 10 [Haliotis rubra]|uniref:multiple epidermal growth factor-like domains protein 10 n=1 Tax=Haliotis rubra TaxID=36100 RepID=UPI001EE5F13F|nr:multiple epidermal growth factor-like domains protein 10 [Haliotis rubra]
MFSFVASCLLLAIFIAGCSGEDCYGPGCQPCGQCYSGTCNNKTGHCLSGCKAHFKLPSCKECEDGWWNDNCSERCGSCSNSNKSCNKPDGHCKSCISGLQPPLCTEVCRKGYYGPNCKIPCGNCSNPNISCDPVSGTCPGRCLDGFIGSNCKTKCPLGTAGPNCDHLCRNCKDNDCDAGGNCTRGCRAGYFGHKCENGGHMMFKEYVIGGSVGCCALILILVVIFLIVRACGKNKRRKHALLTMHHIQKKLSDQARFAQVDPETDLDTASICPTNQEAEPSQPHYRTHSNTCPDVMQAVETSSSGDVKLPVTVTKSYPGPSSPAVPVSRLPPPPFARTGPLPPHHLRAYKDIPCFDQQ